MMKKADTIILALSDSPSQAYQSFETHLGNQEFTVIRSNKKPLTLETRHKKFDPTILKVFGSYAMKVNATIKDSTLHITGTLASGTQVENAGGKKSPVKDGWNKLVQLAKEFSHQQIYYSRN
ncbi:hypothetical protein [Aliifodinibius salipaludis]|nr:hypothetical protein [Aliifodinibius salipaludis]